MLLKSTSPSHRRFVTGSVVPWKSERLGFEVAGRVVEVIEPNEWVTPNRGAAAVESAAEATVLARLDDEALRIAVESARTSVEIAKLNRDANLVMVRQQLPAQIESAKAEANLAQAELSRALKLTQQNAIAKSELDTAQTRVSTANARVASLQAELAYAQARQLALDAQVVQARQQLSEAERNLRNAVLFSPFPGQVSEIHVVPGAFVRPGDPVVTLQMMDPMSVEFEVPAQESRRYQRGDQLAIQVLDGKEQPRQLSAIIHRVDSVADPAARTFTVTVLVRNEIDALAYDLGKGESPIAWTDQITPLNIGPLIAGDHRLYVVREAIHTIDGQTYVWKVTNRRWGTPSRPGDRLLSVTKVPVRIVSDGLPFLGRWEFVAVEFMDSAEPVDVEHDLVTGKLYFTPPGPVPTDDTDESLPDLESWNGSQVLLAEQRWLLRAGDIVQVSSIPDEPNAGFYVPMKAVRQEQGRTFIHVVEGAESPATVRRVHITVESEQAALEDKVLLRIAASPPDQLRDGTRIVVEGTHYLNDGDRVSVSRQAEVQP
ncbi:MAG: HlyD family efflux transporter periplasmic adaptor subunit [Planctomycetota bacterium]|nr:MAG: HlyD family efflux transporter periplasmic adaptor subunit [Planctomycetota bacterium]